MKIIHMIVIITNIMLNHIKIHIHSFVFLSRYSENCSLCDQFSMYIQNKISSTFKKRFFSNPLFVCFLTYRFIRDFVSRKTDKEDTNFFFLFYGVSVFEFDIKFINDENYIN